MLMRLLKTFIAKGLPKILTAGIGTGVAALLAAIAYFSFSRNGFKFRFRSPSSIENTIVDKTETFVFDENAATVSKTALDGIYDDTGATVPKAAPFFSSRNQKHRIVPSISLSGSVIAAFHDLFVEDPDFESIQGLAEAGIIPSKLSGTNSCSESSDDGRSCFPPERFISRQDLINWKAQLEYVFLSGITEQAAVALTSGRMSDIVYNEILRLEADKLLREASMEEIRNEFLEREDIKRFWNEKMNEEKIRGFEVEKLYIAILNDLEEEKIVQVKTYEEYLKEKAAMDCQRQLLPRLKEKVDGVSERLASERSVYVAEQCNLQEFLSELQLKQGRMLDTKSILESWN
ncbi:uncharacterized protein LOC133705274 [Populus nigra]|uniref:uncharacterized protein LOC133705274 n=1 Tax=Populus nigra TaxID=3691 RepID=UPI002B27477F|nr:uncharacterized protein LOC133705274 [Populus nigra]